MRTPNSALEHSLRSQMRAVLALFATLVLVWMSCRAQLRFSEVSPPPTLTPTLVVTITPRPTNTPEPTRTRPPAATPCPDPSSVLPEMVDGIGVYFYCGTGPSHDLVIEHIRHALDANPPGIEMVADFYAFADLRQGVSVQYQWLQAHGYDTTYDAELQKWDERAGVAYDGATFVYLNNGPWTYTDQIDRKFTILHEMHHLLQFELMGSARDTAAWLVEGGADFFARKKLTDLGIAVPGRGDLLQKCNQPLRDLEKGAEPAPDYCAYLEGEQAVSFLVNEFGEQRYYRFFQLAGSGRSPGKVFYEAYELELDEFYGLFDAYRNSGYSLSSQYAFWETVTPVSLFTEP